MILINKAKLPRAKATPDSRMVDKLKTLDGAQARRVLDALVKLPDAVANASSLVSKKIVADVKKNLANVVSSSTTFCSIHRYYKTDTDAEYASVADFRVAAAQWEKDYVKWFGAKNKTIYTHISGAHVADV